MTLQAQQSEHINPEIDYSQYKFKARIVHEQSIGQYLLSKVHETLGKDKKETKSKFSFLSVAEVIVKGINKVTGKNIQLKGTYNAEGKIETIAFYSPAIQIYKGEKR